MTYRFFALLCFCISVASCKKEVVTELLYPVEANDTAIIFSNLTTDTVALDFALVRIKEAHTLSNGALNDGFALAAGMRIIPNEPLFVSKQRFVYQTRDTLRNSDVLLSMGYNIREYPDSPATGIVKNFNKDF